MPNSLQISHRMQYLQKPTFFFFFWIQFLLSTSVTATALLNLLGAW